MRVDGTARFEQLAPADISLWMCDAHVEGGTALSWNAVHGDEILFVVDGELVADGIPCGTDGSITIESGVEATVRATVPTRFVHCADRAARPPTPIATHGLHVLGPRGRFYSEGAGAGYGAVGTFREGPGAVFHADGTCPTCDIALFHTRPGPGFRFPSHRHSVDEMLYVIAGDLRSGPLRIPPGSALAVPAMHRYSLTSLEGHELLTYRAGPSEISIVNDPPKPESALALGMRPVVLAH
jgi:hypothetical protein